MDVTENKIEDLESWKPKALLLGAVIGALTGLGGAYLLIQNAEKHETKIDVTAGQGLKLSLLIMGLLRQVAQLGEGD